MLKVKSLLVIFFGSYRKIPFKKYFITGRMVHKALLTYVDCLKL